MQIRFEWDSTKAASNLRKHGVSFEDAIVAFADGIEIIRIISARAADRKERKRYENQDR
jgi:hypothetical protein